MRESIESRSDVELRVEYCAFFCAVMRGKRDDWRDCGVTWVWAPVASEMGQRTGTGDTMMGIVRRMVQRHALSLKGETPYLCRIQLSSMIIHRYF